MKNLFNNTCNIKEKSQTQGQYGEIIETYNNIADTIPCRLDSAPKNLKVVDTNYKTTIRAYTLFLEKDSLPFVITKEHLVEVSSNLYEVIDVMYYDNNISVHHIEVYLKASDNK